MLTDWETATCDACGVEISVPEDDSMIDALDAAGWETDTPCDVRAPSGRDFARHYCPECAADRRDAAARDEAKRLPGYGLREPENHHEHS